METTEFWENRIKKRVANKKLLIPEGKIGKNLYWAGQMIKGCIFILMRFIITYTRFLHNLTMKIMKEE